MSYWQSDLLKQQGMIAAVSGRSFGNGRWADGDDPAVAPSARQPFLQLFGFEVPQVVFPRLIHGNHVARIYDTDASRGAAELATAIPNCDGLVTKSNTAVLSVSVADCLPIFLYDLYTGAFGVVHAGWRGLVAGVLEQGMGLMRKVWATTHLELAVSIGPSIRADHYIVGKDVADIFNALDPSTVVERQGVPHLDLQGFVRNRLIAEGLPENHIEDSGICTMCQSAEYFSARSQYPHWDGQAGFAIIGRKEIRVRHSH